MWKEEFHKTGSMIWFLVKRDRLRLPVWVLSLWFLTMITAFSFSDLYSSQEERQALAETMQNPAMTAMVGPGYGLDHYTIGAMMSHQMLLFSAILVAIMNILLMVRHTRTDEEEGRIELIRSLPVGRASSLAAAMLVLLAANVLLALFIGIGLYSLGIESIDLNGSLLYGAALGSIGFFFSAVSALFAQLSQHSRGAVGYSLAILGISYILRAIGDVSNETLSWFSPLGWATGTKAYVVNDWWPVVLAGAISIFIAAGALYLNRLRDVGSGFLPSKPGKKHASIGLLSPLGLSLRLQRTSIISWAIGMYLLGVSYGSVLGDLEAFFASSDMMSEMLPAVEGLSLTEQFLTMIMAVISMICTVPALLFMLKVKGEEKQGRTEHLLARSVSRWKLLGSYAILSFFFSFVMVLLAVTGLWSAAYSTMEDPVSFYSLFKGAIVYLPAIWVMIGTAIFLIGFFPALSSLSLFYLAYSFFIVYLGGMMQFPEWLSNLSPFGHVPQIPMEEFDLTAVLLLFFTAAVLSAGGFAGYRNRDSIG
ncbi:ABC transporter permease [Jeotgalibacillus proteolyticus]|uniref:ABC transporter permease n=1 Tax=Jeotgalibacillus proteolyticus TaxID=2082395 RepID=UPI003CED8927